MHGAVALNDLAICNAMDTYFEVDNKDKLDLSLGVRKFHRKILNVLKDKEEK